MSYSDYEERSEEEIYERSEEEKEEREESDEGRESSERVPDFITNVERMSIIDNLSVSAKIQEKLVDIYKTLDELGKGKLFELEIIPIYNKIPLIQYRNARGLVYGYLIVYKNMHIEDISDITAYVLASYIKMWTVLRSKLGITTKKSDEGKHRERYRRESEEYTEESEEEY